MSHKERRDLENKIEALCIAIPRESAAYDYYMELADQYKDVTSRDMFLFLARQEKMHRERLEGLMAELEEKLAEMPK